MSWKTPSCWDQAISVRIAVMRECMAHGCILPPDHTGDHEYAPANPIEEFDAQTDCDCAGSPSRRLAWVCNLCGGKPVPRDLAERVTRHREECLEVIGREWCGYECMTCGLCSKYSHSHAAGRCECHDVWSLNRQYEELQAALAEVARLKGLRDKAYDEISRAINRGDIVLPRPSFREELYGWLR